MQRPRTRAIGVITSLCFFALTPGVRAETKVLASVNELFYYTAYRGAVVSPDARRVAVARREKSVIQILVMDPTTLRELEVFDDTPCGFRLGCTIDWIAWADDSTLLLRWIANASGAQSSQRQHYRIVEFTGGEDTESFDPFAHCWFEVAVPGYVVDSLPNVAGELLFQPFVRGEAVYRVPYARLAKKKRTWRRWTDGEGDDDLEPLARFDEPVWYWLSDASGVVRGALTFGADPLALRIRYRESETAEWRIARTITDERAIEEELFLPMGFTPDGSAMLVAGALQEDRYGLYEYDPVADEITSLFYEHPTSDLHDLIWDASGHELLGVTYLEEGELRQSWFETADARLREALDAAFPGKNPMITGMSRDRRTLSLRVSPPADPGGYFLLDVESGVTTELGRIRPWLDNNLLAKSESFSVRSTDEIVVDAFLTLPPPGAGSDRPPLVVMPHGGPIGVTDTRLFSPDIQYLARMGYAILRVNFRGSGGQGERFAKAGRRQWGRGIEDDIEAAIDLILDSGRVDADRICTHGASYGGYSALMLVVRRPDFYRCASSLMGVTDIALMFNHDDIWLGEAVESRMREIVGDPDKDYAEQIEFSPVYNADKIKIPVLLAHGAWDRRVDWDHMVRMKLALELGGTPVRTIELRKTGHGFARRRDAIAYYKALRKFLLEHIGR